MMPAVQTLTISGYRREAVPNRFSRQNGETDHLALILPGQAYHAGLPLLAEPARLLQRAGADVLRVDYAYLRPDFRALPAEERDRWIAADVTAAWKAVRTQRAYRQWTLVGKSLGTLAMGHLLAADPALAPARCAWLTPIFGDDALRARAIAHRGPALIAVGTADPFYNAELFGEVEQATGADAVVVPDADHLLEIPGDVPGTENALFQVIAAVQRLLGETLPPDRR
jgi:predicted alpha/beta-hydrolase family hydrolase